MSGASGSTGGQGRGRGDNGRFGGAPFGRPASQSGGRAPRRGRPNLWRSPLGAVAVAVAATAYWSTVAWLVAARTSASLVEVDNIGLVDELEIGLDGTGRLPPVMGDDCPRPDWVQRDYFLDDRRMDRPGFRPFSFGIRQLGLARDLPDMTLLDRRY